MITVIDVLQDLPPTEIETAVKWAVKLMPPGGKLFISILTENEMEFIADKTEKVLHDLEGSQGLEVERIVVHKQNRIIFKVKRSLSSFGASEPTQGSEAFAPGRSMEADAIGAGLVGMANVPKEVAATSETGAMGVAKAVQQLIKAANEHRRQYPNIVVTVEFKAFSTNGDLRFRRAIYIPSEVTNKVRQDLTEAVTEVASWSVPGRVVTINTRLSNMTVTNVRAEAQLVPASDEASAFRGRRAQQVTETGEDETIARAEGQQLLDLNANHVLLTITHYPEGPMVKIDFPYVSTGAPPDEYPSYISLVFTVQGKGLSYLSPWRSGSYTLTDQETLQDGVGRVIEGILETPGSDTLAMLQPRRAAEIYSSHPGIADLKTALADTSKRDMLLAEIVTHLTAAAPTAAALTEPAKAAAPAAGVAEIYDKAGTMVESVQHFFGVGHGATLEEVKSLRQEKY